MSDSHDEHDQFAVKHLVEHPVIADSDAPQVSQAAFEAAAGVWMVREAIYRSDDPPTLRLDDAGKFTLGAAPHPNRAAPA